MWILPRFSMIKGDNIMFSIGLMSGTSMDGIDVALIETDGEYHIKEITNLFLDYDRETKILLKAAEYAFRCHKDNSQLVYEQFSSLMVERYLVEEMKVSLEEAILQTKTIQHVLKEEISFSALIKHSTDLHIAAVEALFHLNPEMQKQINVIGYHGQTLFHRPAIGVSVIVGDGQRMANVLGVAVVNDFRSQDIREGGEGAPLAPIYHHALAMKDHRYPVAVVNCGGIANVTFIVETKAEKLIAFDTGPGNALIDRLVKQRSNGERHMDEHGMYGKHGRVDQLTLEKLYEKAVMKEGKNFFLLPPPKSLDSGDMSLIPELQALSLEDACRTLEAFTADTIVKSVEYLSGGIPREWVLVGGGWNNPVIYDELCARLKMKISKDVLVYQAKEIGWNSQAMEAQLMAYLAVRCLQKKAISFPGTTGVAKASCGGNVSFFRRREDA